MMEKLLKIQMKLSCNRDTSPLAIMAGIITNNSFLIDVGAALHLYHHYNNNSPTFRKEKYNG